LRSSLQEIVTLPVDLPRRAAGVHQQLVTILRPLERILANIFGDRHNAILRTPSPVPPNVRMLAFRAMIDRDAPSTRAALEELAKPGTREKLVKFGMWRLRSQHDAEDLVQRALAKVFDPDDAPWKPDEGKSFLKHVGSIINGLASNENASARARHELVDSPVVSDPRRPSDAPPADEALADARELHWFRRLGERLLAKLDGKDSVAVRAYQLAVQGIDEPSEAAEALGCTVEEVYEAHRRLRYHGKQIRAEAEAEEAARMAAVRKSHESRRAGPPPSGQPPRNRTEEGGTP
jgi:DNA-directed RNA polymerase specialized sigma24 family protein